MQGGQKANSPLAQSTFRTCSGGSNQNVQCRPDRRDDERSKNNVFAGGVGIRQNGGVAVRSKPFQADPIDKGLGGKV